VVSARAWGTESGSIGWCPEVERSRMAQALRGGCEGCTTTVGSRSGLCCSLVQPGTAIGRGGQLCCPCHGNEPSGWAWPHSVATLPSR
jgi:hypothetical protein